MNVLERRRQNKEFRVFCWQLLDVICVFLITYLSGIEWERKLVATALWIPIFTLISKYLNKKAWDLWVKKEW